jgi:chromosomal replication initiation ATPase DnaA
VFVVRTRDDLLAVSDRFGLSLTELCGDKRSQNIVYPRQVACALEVCGAMVTARSFRSAGSR